MPSIGLWEWAFIFLIVLVIFGPKSLPKIGQGLGKGIREFKDAMHGISTSIEEEEQNNRASSNSVPQAKTPPEPDAPEPSEKSDT
jgi:TatA/E family protein of Tat protein translocase